MRAIRKPSFVLPALLAGVAAGCLSLPGYHDPDGAADTDADSDADSDSDTDAVDCPVSGGWYDPDSGLCWEDPPQDEALVWDAAVSYCQGLSLGGQGDWRLPKIQELISFIRGCVSSEATGDLSLSTCGVTDPDCLVDDCLDDTDCGDCADEQGPGDDPDNCYWAPGVEGSCNWYWSSSTCASTINWAWAVYFPYGSVAYGEKNTYTFYARCVR